MNKKGGLANNTETKFERDVWYVLTKIKELLQYVRGERINYYDYFNVIQQDSNHSVSPQAEKLVINQLQEMGVVKIEPYKFELENYQSIKMVGTGKAYITKPIPLFESLVVVKKKFDGVYEEYKKKYGGSSKSLSETIFYLTRRGKLYRFLGETEQSYKMTKDSIQHQLISALINQHEPIKSSTLANQIGTTQENLRKEINTLRKRIEDHFEGMHGKDFIPEGQRGDGYCLGKKIKIKEKHT